MTWPQMLGLAFGSSIIVNALYEGDGVETWLVGFAVYCVLASFVDAIMRAGKRPL